MENKQLRALAHEKRRTLLKTLAKQNRIHATDTLNGPDDERTQIALYHNHLPFLEDAGLIEWDRETNHIPPGPHFKTVQPVLRTIEEHAEG